MPKLSSTSVSSHKVWLPSTKDLPEDDRVWFELKDELTLADKINAGVGETAGDKAIMAIISMITAWNYTEDGTPNSNMIPITFDSFSVAIKTDEDFLLLLNEFNKAKDKSVNTVSSTEKKTSSDTTQPDLTKTDSQIQI